MSAGAVGYPCTGAAHFAHYAAFLFDRIVFIYYPLGFDIDLTEKSCIIKTRLHVLTTI